MKTQKKDAATASKPSNVSQSLRSTMKGDKAGGLRSEFGLRLHDVLQSLADPERALGAKAYMRNQYEFFGVPAPDRRRAVGELVKDIGLPSPEQLESVVKELWDAPQREMQHSAMDLMERSAKRSREEDINLYEYCIVHKSWWDTVDFLASHPVGAFFKQHPETRLKRVKSWITDDNMWLNRTAIIFQLSYKKTTDLELLERAIVPHLKSKEFFLQKAIGWALRQYSYTDADYVRDFLDRHQLAPLSVREALKAIRRDGL